MHVTRALRIAACTMNCLRSNICLTRNTRLILSMRHTSRINRIRSRAGRIQATPRSNVVLIRRLMPMAGSPVIRRHGT